MLALRRAACLSTWLKVPSSAHRVNVGDVDVKKIEAELKRLADRREGVAKERSRVTAETTEVVKEARDAGMPVARIADVARLSRERVYRMLGRGP